MRHILLLSSCVVLVAACKPMWDPTFIPSGYTYHHNKYNSPAGPEPAPIGYEYSEEKQARVMDKWSDAVSDLVLRAEANGMRPAGPVVLTTDMEPSAFSGTFAYVLGEELMDAGYTITADTEHPDATVLYYSAYDPELGEDVLYEDDYNDDIPYYNADNSYSPDTKPLELVLGFPGDDVLDMRVSAVYDVPLHGYKPTGYVAPHARPKNALPGEREPAEFVESELDGYND
ncbi:MAG: hypothetical protein JKY71_12430 [Alphaproteobacteria bacterium]|nr:hypothetical protein [Alphaproteobacteria bacterium]